MSHYPIDKSKNPTPIRLFKSDFLEFFTHITPIVILIIWLPIVAIFLVRSAMIVQGDSFPAYIPVGFVIGIFLWTFLEYTLHRFVFHFNARGKTAERIVFLFHGIHHAQPQVKTRLVMPPAASIPMAFIFYGLYFLIISDLLKLSIWLAPLFAGTLFGYVIYDMIHYATHHLPMRSGYLKYLKRHHMAHHYKTPDMRFGVSSPIWDYVFGTMPKDD